MLARSRLAPGNDVPSHTLTGDTDHETGTGRGQQRSWATRARGATGMDVAASGIAAVVRPCDGHVA